MSGGREAGCGAALVSVGARWGDDDVVGNAMVPAAAGADVSRRAGVTETTGGGAAVLGRSVWADGDAATKPGTIVRWVARTVGPVAADIGTPGLAAGAAGVWSGLPDHGVASVEGDEAVADAVVADGGDVFGGLACLSIGSVV